MIQYSCYRKSGDRRSRLTRLSCMADDLGTRHSTSSLPFGCLGSSAWAEMGFTMSSTIEFSIMTKCYGESCYNSQSQFDLILLSTMTDSQE